MKYPKVLRRRTLRHLAAKVLAVMFVAALGSSLYLSKVSAASAQLYMAPGSGTLTQNNNVVVGIRINNGTDSSNAVQANLSYPTAKLQYISTSLSGVYDIVAENSHSSGSIRIGLGKIGTVSGDQLIANVTFKVIGNSGTGSITWDSGSAAVNGGTNVLAGTTNATYSFQAPATTPPPTTGGGTGSGTSGGTSGGSKPSTSTPSTSKPSATTPVATQSAPSSDKTPPQISNIRPSNLGFNAATIEWDTDEGSTSVVDYGPTEAFGATAQAAGAVQKHAVGLAPEILVAGTTFYYRVTSVDAAGNVATSEVQMLRTRGYTVHVKVVDPTGNPVKGAKVSLADGTKESDKDGMAMFTDMPAGQHTVTVEVKGATTTKSAITIEPSVEDGEPLTQSFEVRVDSAPKSSWKIPAIIGGLAVLLLGGAAAYWFVMRGKPPRFGGGLSANTAGHDGAVVGGLGDNPIDHVAKPSLPSSGSVIDPQAQPGGPPAKDGTDVHVG